MVCYCTVCGVVGFFGVHKRCIGGVVYVVYKCMMLGCVGVSCVVGVLVCSVCMHLRCLGAACSV